MKFERVLVPVDFSEDSAIAARVGCVLTAAKGALELVHVDPLPSLMEMMPGPGAMNEHAWQTVTREHEREYGAKLDEMAERLRCDCGQPCGAIEVALRTGEIVETIVQEARSFGAELMVLGAHGEAGSVRFLFGSVACKVSRRASCPVLVTRDGNSVSLTCREGFRNIVVAADHSPYAMASARLAATIAAPDARISLLHIWHPPPGLPLQFSGERSLFERQKLEKLLADANLTDPRFEPLIDVGQPAAKLLDHTARTKADLIVMGAHGRDTTVEKIMGTTADRILRHANVPVLLVPEGALSAAELALAHR